MSRSVQGRPTQSAPQVMLRGRTTPAGVAVAACAAASRLVPSGIWASSGKSMPSANTAASPGRSVTRNRFWACVMFIVAPTASRSSAAGSRWVIFTAVFLMTSCDEAIRDLLGDDEPLAVGADLGEQPGEHLDRVRRRAARAPLPAALRAAEQPVRFLDDGQVAERGRGAGSGTTASRPEGCPVRHPQVLGQPDQHRPHQERLVAVVTHVLDLEHGVGPEQLAEVELVAALEEPAGGTEPQAGKPHLDEAEHVVGDPLAVADFLDDPDRGPLKIGEVRVAGVGVRRDGLA